MGASARRARYTRRAGKRTALEPANRLSDKSRPYLAVTLPGPSAGATVASAPGPPGGPARRPKWRRCKGNSMTWPGMRRPSKCRNWLRVKHLSAKPRVRGPAHAAFSSAFPGRFEAGDGMSVDVSAVSERGPVQRRSALRRPSPGRKAARSVPGPRCARPSCGRLARASRARW